MSAPSSAASIARAFSTSASTFARSGPSAACHRRSTSCAVARTCGSCSGTPRRARPRVGCTDLEQPAREARLSRVHELQVRLESLERARLDAKDRRGDRERERRRARAHLDRGEEAARLVLPSPARRQHLLYLRGKTAGSNSPAARSRCGAASAWSTACVSASASYTRPTSLPTHAISAPAHRTRQMAADATCRRRARACEYRRGAEARALRQPRPRVHFYAAAADLLARRRAGGRVLRRREPVPARDSEGGGGGGHRRLVFGFIAQI